MPIFSDLNLYYGGPSTSFPSSIYTNHVPSYNLPLTSYTPRGGVFSGFSSGLSLVNQPHRLLPTPPRVNKYSPLLPTISETKSLSAIPRRPLPRISSPRVVPAYRAPKPININTADIDVTTPRKRTDRISRDRDDSQHGTIKRGRTVVRLHTKRSIENSGSAQSRRKTPGERLVEKFLIRDKAAEEAKRRKIEEEENRLKHVYKDPGLVEIKDKIVENESCNTARRKSIQDCLQEMEGLIDFEEEEKEFLATQQAADEEEEEPVVMQVTQSEALDLLLSETENEALVIATKPEPAPEPEPPPNTTAKQKTPAEKANTAKKRPRKRDESKIKKADHKSDDMIQPPVEKSLLQRRNTVKKLRRNSRDLTLDLSVDSLGYESSVSSTPGGSMFSTPCSSTVPTPTNSISLTPGGSTLLPGGSAASTPNGLTLPTPVETTPACSTPTVVFESNIESVSLVEMRKPDVPKAQSSNRDMFPFKTKFSDKSTAPIISNKISVDVSVENADDVFKKSPLKFVVDEIKVEESTKSPKSPKLLRYEVTVEEMADKEESFQKRRPGKQTLGAFSSASDGSSTPTEIRGANETDVAFWNTEDAEAHKLSKLVKNLSKVNEKEREKKDCFFTPESTEKTFPVTNKETQNKHDNVESVNNISASQGNVEQEFKFPNLNETQNKNKIKSDVKETAIRTKVNENQANLYAAEQKKNETNSQKTIKNEVTSIPEKAVYKCKCEVATGVFAAETPKVPLITQFISQSAETKVGQDIDSKVLASYPKWGENSDDSTSKLRKILEESGRHKDGDVNNTTSDGTNSKFPFTSNLKDEQIKYGATRIGQKIEIIPKTPPSPEVVPPSNSGENNFRRLDDSKLKDGSVSSDVSSTLGNNGNEKEKNKQTLTIATKNINIPSLSTEQEAEGSSKISENLLENNKVPKLEIKTFTTKQELKKDFQNLKKVTLANKDTTDKRETGIVKTQNKDTLEKDINNKKTTESSKTANSNQKSETTSATGPKDEQSGIPAWKKALIAKAQASNACKVIQNGKPKSAGADTACKNSTADEVKQQSYESKLTGAKQKVQEIKNKETEKQKSDEALSSGEKVKTFGKVSAEKPIVSAVSQVNEGKTKTDETNAVENKVKSGEPLPTEKSKTNETKLVDIKLKSNEKAPIEKTKATEEKLDESKPKSAHISLPDKAAPTEIIDFMPESPKTSLVDKIKLSKTHMTESKQTSSPLEKPKPAEIKSPNCKLKSADTSPAKEKADTTKSGKKQKYYVGKTEATGMKSVDKKQISVETFPVEKNKSAEIETPSTIPAPAEETREAERKVPKPGQKPQALKSKATETSATDKPEPIGTKPKLQKSTPKERRLPEKKLLSTKANIVGQTNPSVTPALEKENPGVASTEEEDTDSPRDDTTADPKPSEPKDKAEPHPETVEKEESSSGEEETDSEEETETETDDDAPSCSSGSSVDSAPSPSLSSNPALGLDPYDDNSPPSTLARGGRVTPPATTIPRFRKYTVEDFQFLKVLGKGSFGKVLLAELKGTECYYAVKCLKKDVVLEDDDVECTLIERKVLALGTKHPYLCHLFCTFQTESHLFFVMEYLNGGDLMFHIQQSGRFPEPRARFYAAEIVSGLKFLHKKGVVYRDLKLDNILLDFDGHVRIADFGMCKLQIYLDRTADTFCGTPDYMAPEIIKGLKYNQCVDWWSFGILLYEMLIGQSPFSGCDEDDLFWSICNEQPHFPRFLSREANGILSLLLEKDSSKRLGTNECIAGDVMDQPFFRNMDWNALEHRDLEPPFKPRVQHPLDVQYFDKAFTAERAKLTPVEREILQSMDQTQFQGFSYTNPNATD